MTTLNDAYDVFSEFLGFVRGFSTRWLQRRLFRHSHYCCLLRIGWSSFQNLSFGYFDDIGNVINPQCSPLSVPRVTLPPPAANRKNSLIPQRQKAELHTHARAHTHARTHACTRTRTRARGLPVGTQQAAASGHMTVLGKTYSKGPTSSTPAAISASCCSSFRAARSLLLASPADPPVLPPPSLQPLATLIVIPPLRCPCKEWCAAGQWPHTLLLCTACRTWRWRDCAAVP